MKHIFLVLLILFCIGNVVSQTEQYERCRFYLESADGNKEYFLPLIFCIEDYLPPRGHVTIKYANSLLMIDTIVCYYYIGKVVVSKNDYEILYSLEDTSKIILTFEYQTQRKNRSFDTHYYEWEVNMEFLFKSKIPYFFQIKNNGWIYNTAIRLSTASSYNICYGNAVIKNPEKSKSFHKRRKIKKDYYPFY